MRTRPYCVGLTGGVACGKSTVAAHFARLGAALVDTDAIAHDLTGPDGAALPELVATFGTACVSPAGGLDRAAMRALVFADPSARERLQAILHPRILREARQQILAASSAPYVVLVVPLLVENLPSYRDLIDRIAVVDCAPAQQIARTAARPGLDETLARAIIAAQIDPASRLAAADDRIYNRQDMAELLRRVDDLHARYLALAGDATGINSIPADNALR